MLNASNVIDMQKSYNEELRKSATNSMRAALNSRFQIMLVSSVWMDAIKNNPGNPSIYIEDPWNKSSLFKRNEVSEHLNSILHNLGYGWEYCKGPYDTGDQIKIYIPK